MIAIMTGMSNSWERLSEWRKTPHLPVDRVPCQSLRSCGKIDSSQVSSRNSHLQVSEIESIEVVCFTVKYIGKFIYRKMEVTVGRSG